MPHVVIADDLTGAADCAYSLKNATGNAVILHTYEPTQEAIVIDTNTRNQEKNTAKKIVEISGIREHSKKLFNYHDNILFKKIDSTLRGHIYTELEAIRHSLGLKKIFICPAYPEANRKVQNAALIIEGIPMHQHPIYGMGKTNAEITRVIKNSHSITEDDYIQGNWTNDITNNTNPYVILDASTDAMLEYIAQKTIAYARRHKAIPMAWCGSAKFLEMLLKQFPKNKNDEDNKPPITKIMLIIGSLNQTTRKQYDTIKTLWEKSHATPSQWQEDVLKLQEQYQEEAKKALHNGCNTILASGGDTASHIWKALGYPPLHCIGRLVPHIPLFQCTYEGKTIYFATKSGGFGNENILKEVYEQWQQ